LEIKCGEEILPYQWINGSVFIEDYSCEEMGSETSQVYTPGVHTLEFKFGNDVKYAYNTAATLEQCAPGLLVEFGGFEQFGPHQCRIDDPITPTSNDIVC